MAFFCSEERGLGLDAVELLYELIKIWVWFRVFPKVEVSFYGEAGPVHGFEVVPVLISIESELKSLYNPSRRTGRQRDRRGAGALLTMGDVGVEPKGRAQL